MKMVKFLSIMALTMAVSSQFVEARLLIKGQDGRFYQSSTTTTVEAEASDQILDFSDAPDSATKMQIIIDAAKHAFDNLSKDNSSATAEVILNEYTAACNKYVLAQDINRDLLHTVLKTALTARLNKVGFMLPDEIATTPVAAPQVSAENASIIEPAQQAASARSKGRVCTPYTAKRLQKGAGRIVKSAKETGLSVVHATKQVALGASLAAYEAAQRYTEALSAQNDDLIAPAATQAPKASTVPAEAPIVAPTAAPKAEVAEVKAKRSKYEVHIPAAVTNHKKAIGIAVGTAAIAALGVLYQTGSMAAMVDFVVANYPAEQVAAILQYITTTQAWKALGSGVEFGYNLIAPVAATNITAPVAANVTEVVQEIAAAAPVAPNWFDTTALGTVVNAVRSQLGV